MEKSKKRIRCFLIILSVLAALKMIFFAFGLDEEYQVVMAYRNATGDRLFLDMWEPHQSSAFLCTLLMKPYLHFFGTTGLVIYLRVCGTLIHLGISLFLYRVVKGIVPEEQAWLLSLIYFGTIPKQIMLPEFGIMQVWFYTLFCLFLIRFYRDGGKRVYLVLAAFALVLNVLAYPSCLLLYPFAMLMLWRLSAGNRWRDMGIFTAVCVVCAGVYLGFLFQYTNPEELVKTLSCILGGDVTHSLAPSGSGRMTRLIKDFFLLGVLWFLCRLSAMLIARWRKLGKEAVGGIAMILACIIELIVWIPMNLGYENMQLYLVVPALEGLIAYHGKIRKEGEGIGEKEQSRTVTLLKWCMAGALVSLVAVVYLTDLSLMQSIPHAMPAAFFGMILFSLASERGQVEKWKRGGVYLILVVWCFTAVIGKGYTLRGSSKYNNVLLSSGVMKYGPAIGTISNYFISYVYNCDYEDWQSEMQDGDKVMIVVDQINNLGTIQYLFRDVQISHFSVVDPTAYDERLLEYWEMFPEKAPNVIIVDCWYGQLMIDSDNWIMQYIENEFGYTEVTDGRYIRIFRK